MKGWFQIEFSIVEEKAEGSRVQFPEGGVSSVLYASYVTSGLLRIHR